MVFIFLPYFYRILEEIEIIKIFWRWIPEELDQGPWGGGITLSECRVEVGCGNVGNTANWNQLLLLEQTANTEEKKGWYGSNYFFSDFSVI